MDSVGRTIPSNVPGTQTLYYYSTRTRLKVKNHYSLGPGYDEYPALWAFLSHSEIDMAWHSVLRQMVDVYSKFARLHQQEVQHVNIHLEE